MCSYNAINGVPACGNSLTMNSIGRDLWGFDGFIISDSGAIPGTFLICKRFHWYIC